MQLWHAGRSSHPENIGGVVPISSSAVAMPGVSRTDKGKLPNAIPREATKEDIQQVIADFKKAAERAKQAEFDGVEIHGAHGYLIDQFLKDGCNKRTDEYGGSIENKARLCLQVIDAVIEVFGSDRVGIKLTPICESHGMTDSDPFGLFDYLIEQFNARSLAFIEVNEAPTFDPVNWKAVGERFYAQYEKKSLREHFKHKFTGAWITNFKQNFESGNLHIENKHADLVSYGELWVCNDNLVERFEKGLPLNRAMYADPSKLQVDYYFGHTVTGYLDLSVYEPPKQD